MLSPVNDRKKAFLSNNFSTYTSRSLDEALKDKKNNLNFIRLCAALLVIVDHAFPLAGQPHWLAGRLGFSLGAWAINTFFFISGLLITRSWMEDPRSFSFIFKRANRILPGLFVAILFCAFIVGPLVTTLSIHDYFLNPSTRQYLSNNFRVFPIQYSLPGVFQNNPYPTAVNGSIWSLPLEIFAYGCVLFLGFCHVLKSRWAMTAIFIGLIYINLHVITEGKFLGSNGIWLYMPTAQLWPLLLSFSFGTMCYLYKEHLILNVYAGFCAVCGFILTFATPTATLGLIFLWGYILLVFGFQNWKLCQIATSKGDFSYGIYIYAFPVQQLTMYYFENISPWVQIMIAIPTTYILAVLSWYAVEKPALQLKKYTSVRKKTPEITSNT